jgi:hypothetical protein
MWEEKCMHVGNKTKVIIKHKIWIFSESHMKTKMTNFKQKQGFGNHVREFYNKSSQLIYISWYLGILKNLQHQKHTATSCKTKPTYVHYTAEWWPREHSQHSNLLKAGQSGVWTLMDARFFHTSAHQRALGYFTKGKAAGVCFWPCTTIERRSENKITAIPLILLCTFMAFYRETCTFT